MTTLPALHSSDRQPAAGWTTELARYVRSSRAIASMLPALLSSGVMTLVVTAVMHLMRNGWNGEFLSLWMESWLTAWPICFPVAYLSGPLLARITAFVSPAAGYRKN